jgi:hypothetical protein
MTCDGRDLCRIETITDRNFLSPTAAAILVGDAARSGRFLHKGVTP